MISPSTVLVVDDVAAIVEELLTLMQLNAIPAAGASDLTAAIAVLEREPAISVVVCDVRLDRESGLDIVKLVDGHPALCKREMRYLFVTGDKMQFNEGDRDPGYCVLTKPVQPAVLIGTLKRMLEPSNA